MISASQSASGVAHATPLMPIKEFRVIMSIFLAIPIPAMASLEQEVTRRFRTLLDRQPSSIMIKSGSPPTTTSPGMP